MNIECSGEKLRQALLVAERGTGRNLNLPVLSAVLFSAQENILTLRSTNLDIGITLFVNAKIKEEGKLAVPAGVLSAFLANTPNDTTITLQKKGDNLYIKNTTSNAVIKCISHEDFPNIPHPKKRTSSFSLESEHLIRGIKSVHYSASVSDVKPELASVYVYPYDNNLVFVATDSFRLAEKKIQIKNTPEGDGFLIPQKNAQELARIFETYPGDITITFGENQLLCSNKHTQVFSRVINQNFPDYTQLIPKESATQATILKQDLIQALKTGTVFSDKFNKTTISADLNKKQLVLETKNDHIGETSVALDAALEGENVQLLCNNKYIMDALQAIPQDSVTLLFNGAQKPLIMKGVGDNSFLYLVSPMNR